MKCLFAQPVSTLDVLPPGQTAAIITITASTLQAGISEKLSALLQSSSTVISALVIALCYSWSLTLITSSGLLLIVITYASITPFLVKRLNEVQHADIQASTVVNEIFSSIRMVSACGAEEKMARRYASWVDESRRRGLKMSPLIAMQQALGKSSLCPVPSTQRSYGTHVDKMQWQSSLPSTGRPCCVPSQRPDKLIRSSTFALSFWYSLKMHMKLEFNSAETQIV